MSGEEKELVDWYRKKFQEVDSTLPCLKCPDERIIECSLVETANYGCHNFYNYILPKKSRKRKNNA